MTLRFAFWIFAIFTCAEAVSQSEPFELELPGDELEFADPVLDIKESLILIREEQERQLEVFNQTLKGFKDEMADQIDQAYAVFNDLIQRTEVHLSKKLSRKFRAQMGDHGDFGNLEKKIERMLKSQVRRAFSRVQKDLSNEKRLETEPQTVEH
ncbi:Oidioi.mRNA.OKI2018_I69.XSR.g14199.t1.cds [Oikopleura dioica]|uniref:Oidioi.mRNA.OKI2018_I69.XSR.g14199.t1.cds n=1 Tax=Oikopleura dioica TaxID=34765 RepID=A0ABN7SD51_OIKDI|nr:Oidioi.mRNA.OKI2018_I69.XSR.g14199.t1.cds [Oikopleura dioica]